MAYMSIPAGGANARADTVNGTGTPLSSLGGYEGRFAYVADCDGNGTPGIYVAQVSSATVDHSTVETVAGSSTLQWRQFVQLQ